MRKVLLIAALLCIGMRVSAGQTVLTHVKQVVGLTSAEAAQKLPIRIEATVTYARPTDKNLFVMEDGEGVYVRFIPDIGLLPGDRVRVTGETSPSFRTTISADTVTFLSHGPMPVPQKAGFEDLIHARLDSQYVEIEGHVLSAAMVQSGSYQSLRLKVQVPQGIVEGIVANPGKLLPENLLDADVRIDGVAAGDFDSKMQLAGVWIYVNSWGNIAILHSPQSDPWSIPVISANEAIFAYRNTNPSARVKIAGTLTYFEPGQLAVVERNGAGMVVETRSVQALHAGDGVEATGFPEISEERVRLANGQLRSATQGTEVAPRNILWEEASAGQFAYNLISMEGDVLAEVHDSRVDLYILVADGHVFSATMRHSSSNAGLGGETGGDIKVGSRVRVTGVCFVEAGNHWRDRLWFTLRMRSQDDILLLRQPPFWTVPRLAFIITLLCLISLGAVGWVWMLRRRVMQQTRVIARKSRDEFDRERRVAQLEQQRSHILELISSAEPLPAVLEEITATVSARLDGARCWFELAGAGDEAGSGDQNLPPAGQNMVSQRLTSHDGTFMGTLHALPPMASGEDADVATALRTGVRLAELAIDTRRLLTDLRHRSEHDLLTGIPNRFSMERQLEQLLLAASHTTEMFGLIYIDLDFFKQVNDRYGHRTGDLYLQAVTQRMKVQLRNQDFLARIGGDEFIALVPVLHNKADAEEIARRLESCFEATFDIEGYYINGSASVGLAVYPDDGLSKEELQRFADAAMYMNKQEKHNRRIFQMTAKGPR
jgi:diguanylate cyclase (GGDEF)-like protein